MNKVTIITPYLFDNEIESLKAASIYLDADFIFEKDVSKIGCDLMYQKLWKKAYPDDIIILHSDMSFIDNPSTWFNSLLSYVAKYPEAGIFGCKLLYPVKSKETNNYIVQCAGGKFDDEDNPIHFGSGLEIFSSKTWKSVEEDLGQYNSVREVSWTTFGGLYIRRQVLEDVGDFDPSFEWTYNRDVDYCLSARDKGWKIYQVPVPLFHFESKDVKRVRTKENTEAEARNLQRLKNKWKNRKDLYNTLNKTVDD